MGQQCQALSGIMGTPFISRPVAISPRTGSRSLPPSLGKSLQWKGAQVTFVPSCGGICWHLLPAFGHLPRVCGQSCPCVDQAPAPDILHQRCIRPPVCVPHAGAHMRKHHIKKGCNRHMQWRGDGLKVCVLFLSLDPILNVCCQ